MQRSRWRLAVTAAALTAIMAAVPLAKAQEADANKAVEKKAKELDEAAAKEGTAVEAPKGFWQSLKALWAELYTLGGRTMIFLAIASIIGLASVLERAISLLIASGSVGGPIAQARRLWAEERFDDIEGLVRGRSGITCRLIDFIVRHRNYHAADVSAGVGDLASRYVKRHVRRNYPLAVVATISPLLGLLGTIIGMIEAFEKVELAGSMGDASYLSGAISKALITTAGGLMIAIPALFFYHVYKFLTGVLADTLEGRANEMVTGWLMRKEAA